MNAHIIDIPPNTREWHAWRAGGVGGSDVPTILGLSPYEDATVRRLVRQKLGLEEPTEFLNWAARRGQLLEPRARKMLADRLAVDISVRCVEHMTERHHRASLDGVWTYGPREEVHICELKALNYETHQHFGRVYSGDAPVHTLPAHLLIQCQWLLYVSGADCCHFCCYSEKRDLEAEALEPEGGKKFLQPQLYPIRLYPESVLWGVYLVPAVDTFWSRVEVLRRVGYGVGGAPLSAFDTDFHDIFPEEPRDVETPDPVYDR